MKSKDISKYFIQKSILNNASIYQNFMLISVQVIIK